jgi:DNA-binding MarR family transcriptional regulator
MVVESAGRSPQTDLGQALRMAWWSYVHRIDTGLESAGYPERRFAMNYVFALYAQPAPMTISEMGRQFDVSRQAASKIVAELRADGYVRTTASSTDQREKVVELTHKAIEYVTARLRAAAEVDTAIRTRLGVDGFDKLREALQAVAEVAGETTELDPANNYRSPKLW